MCVVRARNIVCLKINSLYHVGLCKAGFDCTLIGMQTAIVSRHLHNYSCKGVVCLVEAKCEVPVYCKRNRPSDNKTIMFAIYIFSFFSTWQ